MKYFVIFDRYNESWAYTPDERAAREEAARIGGRYEEYNEEDDEDGV